MKAKTGTGKITSDWGVLDLFQVADGSILALQTFCRVWGSHHKDFALSDANSLCLVRSDKIKNVE